MILNGVMAIILRYISPNSLAFVADYVKVVDSPEKRDKVGLLHYARRTRCALRGSGASC